jgi:hypothetical protein
MAYNFSRHDPVDRARVSGWEGGVSRTETYNSTKTGNNLPMRIDRGRKGLAILGQVYEVTVYVVSKRT